MESHSMMNDVYLHIEEEECTHLFVSARWDSEQGKVIVTFRSLSDESCEEADGNDVFSTGDARHRRFSFGKYKYDDGVPDHVTDEPHWLPLQNPQKGHRCFVVAIPAAEAECQEVR